MQGQKSCFKITNTCRVTKNKFYLQGQGDQDTIGLACTQLDLCLKNLIQTNLSFNYVVSIFRYIHLSRYAWHCKTVFSLYCVVFKYTNTTYFNTARETHLANFVICREGVLVHHLKEDFLCKDISTRNLDGGKIL